MPQRSVYRNFATLAVAFIALLGCAMAEIEQPPISVTPKNAASASGLDVYARDRARGNPVPRFRGQSTVTVRTRGNLDGNGNAEIKGVPCVLDTGLYSAQFTTPANIVVPNYGPNSPALFVRCDTGAMAGSVTAPAINLTNQQRNAGAAGAGILGALVIGAVAAARYDPERDTFGYNPVSVRIK